MRTRHGPSSAQCHDVLDLGEREPEPATLLDEREDAQGVRGIDAVARGGTTRGRQNAARFVEPERLAAGATPRCHLANEEPVLHGARIRLPPRGKVKRQWWLRGGEDGSPLAAYQGDLSVTIRSIGANSAREAPGVHRALRASSLWQVIHLARRPCRGRQSSGSVSRSLRHTARRSPSAHVPLPEVGYLAFHVLEVRRGYDTHFATWTSTLIREGQQLSHPS